MLDKIEFEWVRDLVSERDAKADWARVLEILAPVPAAQS